MGRGFPVVVLVGVWLRTAAWAASAAASPVAPGPAPAPDVTLERYLAAAGHEPQWSSETVEIVASLPKLAERGYLRAIRRILPFGKPEYQVLAIGGDRTVKQQVIARYLTGEVESAAFPHASVAITAANYRFRYRKQVEDAAGTFAYVFEITPRKKRAGLIRGELWLDAASGLVLRQAGRLVRSPSIFVRRVEVARNTDLRDGVPFERVTHLEINTRLVGKAELTITERPYTEASVQGPLAGEESAGER